MNLLKKWFVLSLTFHIVFLRHSLGNNNFSSFLDCDFENNTFCEWENDNIGRAAFKWIIWSGKAPSDMTGPQTSDASGNKNGKFAYMEASQRKQGDNVRLLSRKIQGENCLSLMYHMYGGSMGSLIIYLNTSSIETVEWIKSGNHPDQWFEAAVFFNTSVEYQIVLEGVRGSDFASNIAVDNIAVHSGHCQQQGLGMGCSKDEFSCADGGCVSWALTCNGEKDCEDGTDEPLFCKKQDSANCSLLNLGCALSENKDIIASQTCASNKVKCDFEVGFCGLKHESKCLRWLIASGFTPENSTLRPPFDHTTFSPTGRYMFIEPSKYYQTDVSAVLASDVIDKGEIICIQFWYYMRGQDIGSLKINIRTDKSKTLIWQLTGEQGNKWAFGQVGHKDDSASYQVLLEGAFKSGGISRVIAVDDLYFSSEKECQTLPTKGKEAAPNCLFNSTHCSWMPSNNSWKLSELDPPGYGYWRPGNATFLPFSSSTPTTFQRPNATTTPGCGAVKSNTMRSPGYPNSYPNHIYCVDRVHIPFNQELIVFFKDFNLEFEKNCIYDYLRISDDRNNMIGTYCGNQTGQRVRVVATVAVLTFRSDYSLRYRGFELIFSFSPRGFTYFQSCSSGQTDCHARLSSPLISSGAKWKCLEFWYYTAYPGQLKVLLVPNETTSHTLKTYNYNSYGWRLERVPLSANFNYQVVFEGSLRGFYGADFLVAVGNVVFLPDECKERPSRYNCSRNSSEKDASSYIFSPIYYLYYDYYDYYYYYYHSYEYYYYYYYYYRYGYYKRCNWTISAPYGNVIKLRFIEFELEGRPSCSGDYIEVYDGYYGEFKLLGRYCGQRYPSFLKSSSNVLMILFSDKSLMSVFKLYFSSEKLDAGGRDCIQLKDCPSSCVCFPVSSKSQDMVVTVEEGKEVIYIPKIFPTNTTVIFFQGNKIWHIEKTSFSGLLKLKYLDLSRNHIVRVDDGAFFDTVALETL
ncbi:uncharacterized protein [Acropora muricata]|uniref:uncharacterized protein n=1 Tax=Acropora muricata TaxID=159855 RepID=UPI0034E5C6A6